MDAISTQRLNDPHVHPVVRARISKTIDDCAAEGIYVRATRVFASPNEQHALFIQGREPLDVVNEARLSVKWLPITAEQNIIVTHADYPDSMHCYGLAGDVTPSVAGTLQPYNPDWNTQDPKWARVLEIAKANGLAEGAQWTSAKRDYPHLYPQELDANPTEQMKQDFKDAGLQAVWAGLNLV